MLGVLREQHEDPKADELVHVVEMVQNLRPPLVFNSADMINALERSKAALAMMAPRMTDVHIKDAKIVPDRASLAHRAAIRARAR